MQSWCLQFDVFQFITGKNCIHLYLVPLLLHSIGNLLAYLAASFVTSVYRLLCVRGREILAKCITRKVLLNRLPLIEFQKKLNVGDLKKAGVRLQFSRSQIRSSYVAKFNYFEDLLFRRVLASVGETQLRFCVCIGLVVLFQVVSRETSFQAHLWMAQNA